MFIQCRKYLMEKLKQAGIKTTIVTSIKQLRDMDENHVGAVLYGDETLVRNGSKRIEVNRDGRIKRRKTFDRNLTFSVYIGEYSLEVAENIYETFLELLDRGVYVKGNFIPLELEQTEWIDEDDNIMRSKVGIQVRVTFFGGVYKDTGYAPLHHALLDAQAERKEDIDGKSDSESSGADV